VAAFNQAAKKGLWGQLENLILDQAETERYSLFAGPVFGADDPLFRGVDDEGAVLVRIPRRFWKIVVARNGDDVATFAFILEQDLSRTDLEFAVDEVWRERMISVPDLEALVPELTFPSKLHDSDQFGAEAGEALRAHTGLKAFSG
jgi:endonuclease G